MARDGSGVYNRTQNDYVFGEIISETEVNSELNDIAAALTQSLSKDGQTVPTANLPMGSFKLTGLANGSARTDSVTVGQVQDSTFMWGGTAGGTSDALTIAPSPAITAYAAGQAWRLINQGTANATTTPTIAISGLANRTIKRRDASALAPGDLAANSILDLVDDGTALRLVNFTPVSMIMILLQTVTASGSATVDLDAFSALYDDYIIKVDGAIPLTTGASMACRLKIGGSYQTGAVYDYHVDVSSGASAAYAGLAGLDQTMMIMSGDINTTGGLTNQSFTMNIMNANDATHQHTVTWHGGTTPSENTIEKMNGVGGLWIEGALSGVRFLYDTGNISVGTFRLYGIRK